jgi:uncharacterized protein with FMN-binding domain
MDNQNTSTPHGSNTTKLAITAVALVLIILLVAWFVKDRGNSDLQAPEMSPGTQPTENSTTPAVRRYSDGTYTQSGSYVSPAGVENIDITLVIKDDVVVSGTFQGFGTNPTTQFMQGKFRDGFNEAVTGKSIDELNLTVVNGSSLTPKGFMEALQKIKAESNNS